MRLTEKKAKIVEFKELYKSYLKLSDAETSKQIHEREELRSKINQAIAIVNSHIEDSGEVTWVHYAPPPMVGGWSGKLDLLPNIFNKSIQRIDRLIFDMLDKSLGRYDVLIADRKSFWKNPIRWIGELIRIPFYIIQYAGFSGISFEVSMLGKIYKLVAGFAVFLGSLVTFLGGTLKIYEFIQPRLPVIQKTLEHFKWQLEKKPTAD